MRYGFNGDEFPDRVLPDHVFLDSQSMIQNQTGSVQRVVPPTLDRSMSYVCKPNVKFFFGETDIFFVIHEGELHKF